MSEELLKPGAIVTCDKWGMARGRVFPDELSYYRHFENCRWKCDRWLTYRVREDTTLEPIYMGWR